MEGCQEEEKDVKMLKKKEIKKIITTIIIFWYYFQTANFNHADVNKGTTDVMPLRGVF